MCIQGVIIAVVCDASAHVSLIAQFCSVPRAPAVFQVRSPLPHRSLKPADSPYGPVSTGHLASLPGTHAGPSGDLCPKLMACITCATSQELSHLGTSLARRSPPACWSPRPALWGHHHLQNALVAPTFPATVNKKPLRRPVPVSQQENTWRRLPVKMAEQADAVLTPSHNHVNITTTEGP